MWVCECMCVSQLQILIIRKYTKFLVKTLKGETKSKHRLKTLFLQWIVIGVCHISPILPASFQSNNRITASHIQCKIYNHFVYIYIFLSFFTDCSLPFLFSSLKIQLWLYKQTKDRFPNAINMQNDCIASTQRQIAACTNAWQ